MVILERFYVIKVGGVCVVHMLNHVKNIQVNIHQSTVINMSDYIQWVAEGEPGYYRIVEYIQALEKVVKWGDYILELGTHAPLISDYFRRNHDCRTAYSGVFNRVDSEHNKFFYSDLCVDPIPPRFVFVTSDGSHPVQGWDIVTATEVLEHLPCNLYVVADKLINAVRCWGYLFVSAPVAGIERGDKKLDDELESPTDLDKQHLREFNGVDELKSLFPDLRIVDEWFSESRLVGQGNYCYNILYQKI